MTITFTLPTLRRARVCCAVAPLLAASAFAQLHVGVVGGYAGSITQEGLAGFSETRLGRSSAGYSASAGYRFSGGFTLGVRAAQIRLQLTEQGANFGDLQMQPVVLSVGYQGMPNKGRGFTYHGQIGGGVAFTKFAKGPFITGLERSYGVEVLTQTKTAPAVELGGGVDYFLTRHVSFTTDFQVLLSNVGTSFTAVGVRRVQMPGWERFFASNGQAMAGIRLWLR